MTHTIRRAFHSPRDDLDESQVKTRAISLWGITFTAPPCDLGLASTGTQTSPAARQASLEEYVKFASV
jgi:hypothetical protein